MSLRVLDVCRLVATFLVFGLGFGVTPAAACGFGCWSSWAPAPVVIQTYAYQPCSCCGCGASYYSSYYPAYASPSYPSVYAAATYAVAPPLAPVVAAPPVYGPRLAPRYWGPRRGLVARY
ncbi:MAG: hypothetical protein IT537_10550 [Hyphomicrobiales bacterium]|nr:hypothetical protein [Hyphomicrobiales bacterium]